ncbi:hypothetical protein EsDP_00005277 [Epichloe bromicola]|uniref:Peptidase M43 pregnancy-associated plasma-A domain-containing protein n=1 Tax=Epichloe bromicola TaxID=79588 RepID=A0ABQ0CU71_9HYPO
MALNESMISTSEFAALANINVPVYAHVVSRSNNEHLKDEDVRAMITGISKDYDNMGFQFALKSVDYTLYADWSSGQNEMAMKKKLRKGGYRTLKLYYVNSLPSSSSLQTTGLCYYPYPTNDGKGSDTLTRDGCTIRRDLLNNGQTTTHKVGHWLGLLHAFEGGCTGGGDQIADTPACETTRGCDENTDTCPEFPEKDDVHNFMFYGTCRTRFIVGQAKRAHRQYNLYRA